MDCPHAHRLMDRALLGEAGREELALLEEHLSRCPACREAFDRLRSALGLTPLEVRRPPLDLAHRLLRVLRPRLAAARSRRLWRRRLAGAGLALGCAAAVVLAVVALSPRPTVVRRVCTCWRFVQGDSGNSRWRPFPPDLPPTGGAWSCTVEENLYKPIAWRNLLVVGASRGDRLRRGGMLLAFDTRTGRLRWKRTLPSGDLYKASNFPDRCILAGKLYITDGQRCLVWEAATGRHIASFYPPAGVEGWGYLTATRGVLVGLSRDGGTVFSLDAVDSRVLWVRRLEGSAYIPALCAGCLYLATDRGEVVCLSVADGRLRWRRRGAAPRVRSSLHARGRWLILVSLTGEIRAFVRATGKPLWRRRVPGAFFSQVAIGEGVLYARGGEVALALADGRTLRRRTGPPTGRYSPPAALGNQLVTTRTRPGALSTVDPRGRTATLLSGLPSRGCLGPIVSRGRVFVLRGGRLYAAPIRATG